LSDVDTYLVEAGRAVGLSRYPRRLSGYPAPRVLGALEYKAGFELDGIGSVIPIDLTARWRRHLWFAHDHDIARLRGFGARELGWRNGGLA
jgi:hypothetical protein